MNVFMIVGVVLLFIFVFLSFLKKRVVKQQEELAQEFGGSDILKKSLSANCFGQESLGMAQVRGNGSLILMDDVLFFKMWMPEKVISISVDSIKSAEIVKSHLGKSKFCPLFKVHFTNEQGQDDSVAWLVKKPEEWIQAIEKLIQ